MKKLLTYRALDIMDPSDQRKRVYCPHCDNYISRTSFYGHKLLHFDDTQQVWRKESEESIAGVQVSFEFSPECSTSISDGEGNAFINSLGCSISLLSSTVSSTEEFLPDTVDWSSGIESNDHSDLEVNIKFHALILGLKYGSKYPGGW